MTFTNMRVRANMGLRNAPGTLLTLFATLVLMGVRVAHGDDDLVIDGIAVTVPGNSFRTVVVKNAGALSVTGTLSAQEIYVENGALTTTLDLQCAELRVNGSVTVRGSLACVRAVFADGASTVLGTNNNVNALEIGGILTGLGTWSVQHLNVQSGGTFRVCSLDGSHPRSGTLKILSDTTVLGAGGHINATGAGNDARGRGGDWYRSATGGSCAGQGGRGYWTSSGEGVRPAFDSPIAYEACMGGAGGAASGLTYGGGAVHIEAETSLCIEGSITADGLSGGSSAFGGGAGGTILLRSPAIRLHGGLSARGGNGGIDCGGGGGGGYIKVFYDTLEADPEVMSNIVTLASVRGGTRGGYLNTQNGGTGKVHFDHMPKVGDLIAPPPNATVPHGSVMFRFRLVDLSGSLDGRNDSITPRIELSRDGFETVPFVFDNGQTIAGWNQTIYYSGDTAEYTVQTALPEGAYQWRVTLRDLSLWSRYTTPRTLLIGDEPPNTTLSLDLWMTPSVAIMGAIGTRCAVEYTEDLVQGAAWHTLAIVTLEARPHVFFDTSGSGKPRRFYRIQQLP